MERRKRACRKRRQRVQATVTGRTSNIAVELASDKEETNKILGNLGLPVPQQRLVQREDDAVSAAARIGFPVVVKPYNGNHGRGVSINLMNAEQVLAGVPRGAGRSAAASSSRSSSSATTTGCWW